MLLRHGQSLMSKIKCNRRLIKARRRKENKEKKEPQGSRQTDKQYC